jgi:hypothetical protein
MLGAIADSIIASTTDPTLLSKSFIFLSGDNEQKPDSVNKNKGSGGGKGKEKEKEKEKDKEGVSSSSSSLCSVTLPMLPNVSGPFLLLGAKEELEKVGKAVCAHVDGKGGGRPGRTQGVASKLSVESLTMVLETLNAALE